MHIAVIIVGYKNAEDICLCLDALARTIYRDFEIIICENGGEAAYQTLIAAIPTALKDGQPVKVIQAPGNVGYAGGVNIGLKAKPDADSWWILNPDTEPHPEALEKLAERLERGDCDAVGGVLHREDGKVQSDGGKWNRYFARAVSLNMGRQLDSQPDAAQVEAEMNYISGASMLVSKKFVEQVGLMREDYFLYCEEVEWCLRARKRGIKLGFAPEARVKHAHGSTTGQGSATKERPRLPIYLDERNKILLTRDLFPMLLPFSAPSSLILIALRFLRRGAIPQFSYGLQGWLAGIKNLRGSYVP